MNVPVIVTEGRAAYHYAYGGEPACNMEFKNPETERMVVDESMVADMPWYRLCDICEAAFDPRAGVPYREMPAAIADEIGFERTSDSAQFSKEEIAELYREIVDSKGAGAP